MNFMTRQAAIVRATGRSGNEPSAQQCRRHRFALLLALLAGGFLGVSLWIWARTGAHEMVEAAIAPEQSLAQLIHGRSPGTRAEGQLIKTKTNHFLASRRLASRPRIRVSALGKPKVTSQDHASDLPYGDNLLTPPLSVMDFAAQPVGLGTSIAPISTTGPGENLPSAGPNFQSTPLPPGASALPEPQAWATMLIGFALIGWRLRRGGIPGGKALLAAD